MTELLQGGLRMHAPGIGVTLREETRWTIKASPIHQQRFIRRPSLHGSRIFPAIAPIAAHKCAIRAAKWYAGIVPSTWAAQISTDLSANTRQLSIARNRMLGIEPLTGHML